MTMWKCCYGYGNIIPKNDVKFNGTWMKTSTHSKSVWRGSFTMLIEIWYNFSFVSFSPKLFRMKVQKYSNINLCVWVCYCVEIEDMPEFFISYHAESRGESPSKLELEKTFYQSSNVIISKILEIFFPRKIYFLYIPLKWNNNFWTILKFYRIKPCTNVF